MAIRVSSGIMLSCANGEVVAVSMMAMVRAPKPNTRSVQSVQAQRQADAGSDRIVVDHRRAIAAPAPPAGA